MMMKPDGVGVFAVGFAAMVEEVKEELRLVESEVRVVARRVG